MSQRRNNMCYNCGCGNPNDDMGNQNNITNLTFQKAAEAEKQELLHAKTETLKLLARELNYELTQPTSSS